MSNPIRDPSSFSVLTYAWMIFLSTLGGFVNFMAKRRRGMVRAFNLTELIGELVTSGFAGLLTFYACEFGKIDPLLTAVFVGISGHMGSRIIFAAERFLERWAAQRYPILRDLRDVPSIDDDPNDLPR